MMAILLALKILLLLLLGVVRCLALHLPTSPSLVQIAPVTVELDNVSMRYPLTLKRRLFSATPHREYALRNVSCQLLSEVALLCGPSECGKSTILKLISGQDKPSEGVVRMTCELSVPPKPIYLDQRPSVDSYTTLEQLLSRQMQALPDATVAELVLIELRQCLELTDPSLLTQTPMQLSPSENYRIQLLRACLDSMCRPGLSIDSLKSVLLVPAPVVLLDEWLDTEPSSVIARVHTGLAQLSAVGGVVCVVTHQPERFPPTTRMVLRSGQLQSVQRVMKRY